jgi:hypothetical protein
MVMKRVHYLMGAVGAAPALLGLGVQGHPAAPAHAAQPTVTRTAKRVSLEHAKMVPAAGCIAGTEHVRTSGRLKLTFWSTTHPNKTCIGTIVVHANYLPGVRGILGGYVRGLDGNIYCFFDGATTQYTYGCHGSFYRPFSVIAWYSSAIYSGSITYRIG